MCHVDCGGGFPRVKSGWKDEEEGRRGGLLSLAGGEERGGGRAGPDSFHDTCRRWRLMLPLGSF